MKDERMKFQVFISSVSEELREERQELISRLLLKNRYFPIAMEHFSAANHTIGMLEGYLRQTDIYVLILKNEKGSPIGEAGAQFLRKLWEENPTLEDEISHLREALGISLEELSFTQVEYALAQAYEIPTLMFVYAELGKQGFVERIRAFLGEDTIHTAADWGDKSVLTDKVVDSLDNLDMSEHPLSGWVRKADSDLYSKAHASGILELGLDGRGFTGKLGDHLKEAKELFVFYTTGKGFVHNNQELLAEFVAGGGTIRFITGLPKSAFLQEVARAEIQKLGRRADIHREYFDVMDNLQTILSNARKKWQQHGGEGDFGRIYVAGAKTLFRSSILICRKEKGQMWGWLAVTLPPEKSVDMISMELRGPEKSEEEEPDNLLTAALRHMEHVWQIAEEDKLVVEVTEELTEEEVNTRILPRAYWEEKWEKASKNMRLRKRKKEILIEVAAQHPLKDGIEPDTEFAARLTRAAELYEKFTGEGKKVTLYVPGSVHLDSDGVPEEVSLSTAGTEYLLDLGIPEEAIHGDDLNDADYPGREVKGVYNSADECFVAARYFLREESEFSALYCVCSPYQADRKTLFYAENGVIPKVITVPAEGHFHHFLGELFECLPMVTEGDHNWQSADSREALRTRRERMPGFSEEQK